MPFHRDAYPLTDDEVSLRELAIVPLKRKRAVLGCALFGLVAATLITVTMTPKYRATATIELNEDKSGGVSALSDLASAAGGGADELKVKMQTEIAVIKNDSIALNVMSSLGMLRPGTGGRGGKAQGDAVDAEQVPARQREELIQRLESRLSVKEVENSRLIAITYASEDPAEAARVANEIVTQYREYLLRSNFSSSKEVSQWLAKQLSDLSSQVTKSETSVADFERTHNLSSAMPGLSALGHGSSSSQPGSAGPGGGMRIPELDRLGTLNDEVTQAEALRISDEAIYRLTETQNPEVISSLSSSSLPGMAGSTVLTQGNGLQMLNALREQEATAKVAYADAATKYGRKNPRLREIESQLKSLKEQIQGEMGKIKQRAKNDLTLAIENEKALRSAYEAQKSVTSKMNDDVVQLGILMEQASSSRELYDLLFAKLQEANIDSGSSAVNVTIADPARPPGKAYLPKRTLFPAAGLLGGLAIGVALAYLLESQDDTVADSFEVEAMAHAPVLGLIPFQKRETRAASAGALANESSPFLIDPEGATAEALRSLRSGLTLSGAGRKLKVLAITSALGGEGKSYTTYNLGLAFAATGLRVLIIDADLRRPRQDALFRVSRKEGLSNLLAGLGSFGDYVRPHPVAENFFLLTAGQSTPLASELLESGEIAAVLKCAREQFDPDPGGQCAGAAGCRSHPCGLALRRNPGRAAVLANLTQGVAPFHPDPGPEPDPPPWAGDSGGGNVSYGIPERISGYSLEKYSERSRQRRERLTTQLQHSGCCWPQWRGWETHSRVPARSPGAAGAGPGASAGRAAAVAESLGPAVLPADFPALRIEPGDLLRVAVYDTPELSDAYRVDPGGDLAIPLCGKVRVEGLTSSQAARLLEKTLRDGEILTRPQVNVDVQQYAGRAVTVLGEVANPGRVTVIAPTRLSEILAQAGGLTALAGTRIEISDGDGEGHREREVPYSRSGSNALARTALVQPGDTVTVPRAGIVYVLGAVYRPGGYVMQEDGTLNVAEALALSGGTLLTAKTGGLEVIRRNPDGTVLRFTLSYGGIARGTQTPLDLRPQDIVYVPMSKVKATLTDATAILSAATSAAIYTAR